MNKLSGAGLFLILGAVTAACGSSSNAFTSGDPSGGASASGGAPGGGSAGTGNGSSGAGNAGAGVGGSSNGTSGAGGNGSSGGGNRAGAGGSGAGGGSAGAGGGSAGTGGGSAGTGGGPECPTLTGYYTTITTEGAGCGDYDSSVPVCAAPGVEVCRFKVKGDGDKSLDGSLGVKANDTFDGAMVTEGSATRTGCVGTFSPAAGVLTIACGGTDATSGQFCRIKLTRTASVCP